VPPHCPVLHCILDHRFSPSTPSHFFSHSVDRLRATSRPSSYPCTSPLAVPGLVHQIAQSDTFYRSAVTDHITTAHPWRDAPSPSHCPPPHSTQKITRFLLLLKSLARAGSPREKPPNESPANLADRDPGFLQLPATLPSFAFQPSVRETQEHHPSLTGECGDI
jgi:hypothetical protein